MTNKNLKDSANRHFSARHYREAFYELLELGVSDFIALFPRSPKLANSILEKHLVRPEVNLYFWKDFILLNDVFDRLFSDVDSIHLLHLYFTNRVQNAGLVAKLALLFPRLLIQGVRLNAAFLNSRHWESLNCLQFNDTISTQHQYLWRSIRECESELWKRVLTSWEKVKKYPLEKVMIELCMWCEREDWQAVKRDNVNLLYLSGVYNMIVSLIISEHNNQLNIDPNNFDHYYQLILESRTIDTELYTFASSVLAWNGYKENFINLYCYNDDFQIVNENGNYFLKATPKSHYRWKLNGLRYEINQSCYFLDCLPDAEEHMENGTIKIGGTSQIDYDINYKMVCDQFASKNLLKDMCIAELEVDGVKIDVLKACARLIGLSTNRRVRNELYKEQVGVGDVIEFWQHAKKVQETTGLIRLPYLLETKDSLSQLLAHPRSGTTIDEAKVICDIITCWKSVTQPFDRFNHNYDVFLKPFIGFGEVLFCPALFLGRNAWFYSLAQEALRNNSQEKNILETERQEAWLGECFRTRYPHTIVVDKELRDKLRKIGHGDVDIVVTDGKVLLLIQQKRPYFRVTTKDAHIEDRLIDEKASRQLNNIESTYLNDSTKFLEALGLNDFIISQLKVVKWIVSTSFENIGTVKHGCQKINYFDVLRAIRYPHEFESLQEFISYVSRDEFYLTMAYETAPEIRALAPIPLPMLPFEQREYVFLIKDNTESVAIWNNARDAYDKGDNVTAIQLYERYVAMDVSSGEGWGALANIYADLKLSAKAEDCFIKAISFSPDDPYIKRNYGIWLFEIGSFGEALKVFLELFELYPLLEGILPGIYQIIDQLEVNGQSHKPDVIELIRKWEVLREINS